MPTNDQKQTVGPTSDQKEFALQIAGYVHDQCPSFADMSKMDAMQEAILVLFQDEGAFTHFLEVCEKHHVRALLEPLGATKVLPVVNEIFGIDQNDVQRKEELYENANVLSHVIPTNIRVREDL